MESIAEDEDLTDPLVVDKQWPYMDVSPDFAEQYEHLATLEHLAALNEDSVPEFMGMEITDPYEHLATDPTILDSPTVNPRTGFVASARHQDTQMISFASPDMDQDCSTREQRHRFEVIEAEIISLSLDDIMSKGRSSAQYDGLMPLSILNVIESMVFHFKYDNARPGWPCPNVAQEILDNFDPVNVIIDDDLLGGLASAIRQGLAEEMAKIRRSVEERHETALHVAASRGDLEQLRRLIEEGLDVGALDSNCETPLQLATWNGRCSAVRALLQAGAKIEYLGGRYGTAMDIAARLGDTDMVRIFIDKGVEVAKHPSSLAVAAQYKQHEVVKLLLDHQADPNSKDEHSGYTALHSAAQNGDMSLVKLLVNMGAAVNLPEARFQQTSLHLAAEGGHATVVEYLINMNADVNARGSPVAGSVLHAACRGGNLAIVQNLVLQGADVSYSDGYNGVPLQAAAASGRLEVVRLLLGSGIDINERSGNESTPLLAALKEKHYAVAKALLIHSRVDSQSFEDALYYAAQHGRDDLVALLLQQNPRPILKMTNLGTALHAACIGYVDDRIEDQVHDPKTGDLLSETRRRHFVASDGHTRVVQMLLDHGADIEAVDNKDGKPPLHWAVLRQRADIVTVLLQRGADIEGTDNHLRTPLLQAASCGYLSMVRLLQSKGAKINTVDEVGHTPVWCAMQSSHSAVVQWLLRNGADPEYAGW
jgi:ankyrin repeat protein